MKKIVLSSISVIIQLLIWALSWFCFFWFIDDYIRKLLGASFYNTYGKAARPYLHLYFLLVLVIAVVVAVLYNKIITIRNSIFLTFIVVMNIAIYLIIAANFIGKYGFVV